MNNVYVAIAFVVLFCGDVFGQGTLSSIGRVETVEGTGTGFVVDPDPETPGFQVWTAGHVVSEVGENVAIRFDVGKSSERLYAGVVIKRRFDSQVDAAIVEVKFGEQKQPLEIGNSTRGAEHYYAGYSGFGFRGLRIIASSRRLSFGGRLWSPESRAGESGSPVWNKSGVIAVVVAKTGRMTITQPISDWLSLR